MKEKTNKYILLLEKQSFINDLKFYFYEQELLHKKLNADTLNNILECIEFMQDYIIKDKYDNISYSKLENKLIIKCKTSKIEIYKRDINLFILKVNNHSNNSFFDIGVSNNVIQLGMSKDKYEKVIINNICSIIINTFLDLLSDYYNMIYYIDSDESKD